MSNLDIGALLERLVGIRASLRCQLGRWRREALVVPAAGETTVRGVIDELDVVIAGLGGRGPEPVSRRRRTAPTPEAADEILAFRKEGEE